MFYSGASWSLNPDLLSLHLVRFDFFPSVKRKINISGDSDKSQSFKKVTQLCH